MVIGSQTIVAMHYIMPSSEGCVWLGQAFCYVLYLLRFSHQISVPLILIVHLVCVFVFLGLEGGFDNNEPEYDESYQIVLLPDYLSLPFPSVELPEKVSIPFSNCYTCGNVSCKKCLVF